MSHRPRIQLEGRRQLAMETARNRLMVGVFLFAGAFLTLAARTVELGVMDTSAPRQVQRVELPTVFTARADIVDRNGVVLATNLETSSLYADPKRILDVDEAVEKLLTVFPDMNSEKLRTRLTGDRRFVWIKRKLTPHQTWKVNALGVPGLSFQQEEERIYPHGHLAAHVLGFVDPDGRGLAGSELYHNARLKDENGLSEPLVLSIDLRVQHALSDELSTAMSRHSAIGGAGLVMDVTTGEVLAMVSLPDFDPNRPGVATDRQLFNRASKGVYELGSTFKTFTIAAALDSKSIRLKDVFDATNPIKVSRFTIRDDHPKARPLSVPEIYAYSSNIGAAKIAMKLGGERQQEFYANLGFFDLPAIELEEVGMPIVPDRWRDVNTMTSSYGHGLAVSPMHLGVALSAMVNGGNLIPATMVKQDESVEPLGRKVISNRTSKMVRQLMRAVVTKGTASKAEVPGYRVGGKTGTAEKAIAGGYSKEAVIASFAGVFPIDQPRYLVITLLDEPKGTEATLNYAGGGWVSAPVARNIIARIAPMLGVEPKMEDTRMQRHVNLLFKKGG